MSSKASVQALALAILLFPAAGGIFLGVFNWRGSRLLTAMVGPGVIWAAFVCVLILLGNNVDQDFTYWTWIRAGSFEVPFDILIDHLSLFMCLVITGVGGLIVTYAVGYMEHETDGSYARFFCYMDVFVLAMLILVLAGNTVFLIVGWAGVGLSSYLLIGFYYWRRSAVIAARKAFVMNVIGDIGMILGAFVLFVSYHQVVYLKLFPALPHTPDATTELAAFLLLVGGIAKSAQLPLHTWLPDAMEGPTPVSALIHAATMVTAGVYLVARFHPLYDATIYAHAAVAIIGAVTALFAASIALVQTDIKRVLAYSTMSQIGYMFLAVGIGAYSAGLFHLLSHAFFKALLFMAAGNVIHALHDDQDMRHYGGLWHDMRRSSVTFLAGSLSLAGIIPFVGFFSKENVLGEAFSRGDGLGYAVWFIGFVTAVLTGFYTGRMWWFAFWRPASEERPVAGHLHEAPLVMLVPVAVLAVLTTVGGFLQIKAIGGWALVDDFLKPVLGEERIRTNGLEYLATVLTLVLAALAFAAAYNFWIRGTWSPAGWRARYGWGARVLERKYYFDELYDWAFVRPLDRLAGFTDREDRSLIDTGAVDVGAYTERGAGALSLTQTGFLRSYVLVFVAGVVIAAVLVLWRASS